MLFQQFANAIPYVIWMMSPEGETIFVNVSAIKGENIDQLLDDLGPQLVGAAAAVFPASPRLLDQRVDQILTELDLPPERRLAELSGGWRRRVARRLRHALRHNQID